MAMKEFTAPQVEILVMSLNMYINSMERRIVAEVDVEARTIWQRKADNASVLLSKIRSA